MKLVIFRHGDALATSEDGSDFSRKLSQQGIDDVKISSENLKKTGFIPDIILTSPLIRAKETADIIKSFFGDIKIVISNELEPNSSIISVLKLINSFGDKNIILVSHMPLVYEISHNLLGEGMRFPTSSYVYLVKKGENFEIFSRYKV